MRNPLPIVAFSMLAFLAAAPVSADEASLAQRLEQLESETQTLRAELEWLREHPVRLPQVEATPVALNVDEQTDYYTFDQIQSMMTATAKKYAWRKGDFSVTPYGFLWGSMAYESERTNDGDTTLYVYSRDTHNDDAYHVNARATRMGLDVAGPRLRWFNCAASGGKVEIDFYGSFVTENKPGVLLRHAYWEIKDDEFRLLMGQTWDIIGPLNPGTIMYSVYWGAGNIGYRRAQLRGERYLAFSNTALLTLQGSINANIVSDFTGLNDGVSGDHGGWPMIEGRAAWTFGHRGKNGLPTTLGVSGHIGEQIYTFTAPAPIDGEFARRTWSANVDLRMPITERFGVQGEFFTGENLCTFLGGILQGIDRDRADTVYSTGGWVECWYDWSPRWHTNVGYTIDDPWDRCLSAASARIYNQAYYVNLVHDVTKQFKVGAEVSSWKTLYKAQAPGESVRVEFMAKYGF